MFVCIDDAGRITAYNPHDLSGNTGWTEVPETLADPIVNGLGAALYKYENGHAVPRTAAEIEADTPQPKEPPLSELDQLRADVDYIAMETGVSL